MEIGGRCLLGCMDAWSNFPCIRTSPAFERVLVLPHNAGTCQVSQAVIDRTPFLTATYRAVITSKTDDDRSDDEDDGEEDTKED